MSNRIEISRGALLHNAALFRKLCGSSRFYAVIKSNAYGHGFLETATVLKGHADGFALNSIGEAAALRAVDPETPILIMGMNDPATYGWLSEPDVRNVTLVVSTVGDVEELVRRGPRVPFHIKIDTGMSRLGLRDRELTGLFDYLADRPGLPWTGVMTHFANVEDVSDQSFAQEQLTLFREATEAAGRAAGNRKLLLHAAASAAAMILPESRFDLCRIGISLYGLWPSRQTRLSALNRHGLIPDLFPALTWKSRIVHLHSVPPDSSVGYGLSYRTATETRIAVIPTGYFEGYERALSNRSHVLIGGKRARLIGRVCMNMIMADISHIDRARVGDEVVLIGSQGEESVTADDLADLTHTINYEVVTRIQRDIPRIVVD